MNAEGKVSEGEEEVERGVGGVFESVGVVSMGQAAG